VFNWGAKDRRAYERINTLIPCRLEVEGELFVGKTQDISLGGVCFKVELGPGRPKKIRNKNGKMSLILPKGEFLADCSVIRASSHAVAIKFVNFEGTEQKKLLREFLETQVTYLTKLSRRG